MKALLQPLEELKEFQEIRSHIEKNNMPIQVTGCIDSQKCHLIAGLGMDYLFQVIVTSNELKARELYEDYKLYDRNVCVYPAKDAIFYSADARSNAIIKERLMVLKRLIERKPTCIITTLDSGMDKLLPLEYMASQVFKISEGDTCPIEELKVKLVKLGYERVGQVDGTGQFAIRGGIIDIYPLTEECPYRIEMWDEEIDTIRSFDVESQRSIENVHELIIYPASEVVLTEDQKFAGRNAIKDEMEKQVEVLRGEFHTEEAHRLKTKIEEFLEQLEYSGQGVGLESYMDFFYTDTVSFFDYFSKKDTLFCVDEPNNVQERAEVVEMEFRESMAHRLEKGYVLPSQSDVIYPYKLLIEKLAKQNVILLSGFDTKPKGWSPKTKSDWVVSSVASYHQSFEMLIKDLENWKNNGYRTIVFSSSKSRAKRLSEDLRGYELPAFLAEDPERLLKPGEIMVAYGNLHRGFTYPLMQFAVVSESDIFGEKKGKKKKKKSSYEGRSIQNFTELNIGDYVIHENHGVGIYKGIEKVKVDRTTKDYIKLEYADGGNLYVLATGLEVLQKYSGSEGKTVKVNKLGAPEWRKAKQKARNNAREVAKELVELYAIRQKTAGYQFGKDTVWQKEFEEMFPYEETDDQLSAIEATKNDMESKKIMDRLICGDVGFGKTEIAIRAAFKAVSDGKQVAFLVPTTILAQQHYNTFVQRMKDFPIRIGMLSRFRTSAQQKKDLEELKKGQLDIIIGTHRLLSKDIAFKNLGLLIVDEEQRFGVTHKEKIKMLRQNVDVLTLSATPIPRTLHMSLIGIRDMSVLEEPPIDRLPIQTFVMEENDEVVREAINREISRNGQVFYVFNRVNQIEEVALHVAKLVPHATVAFAHGQMKPRELEKVMYQFMNGEIDVLVATTIVETGLDISNVNTMIIHDADRLGLSQLYQLRGRVGRSNRTAYAFLLYKRDRVLREVAEKRLQAMREFTELGAGFKIAMTDLELRGAGSLLGDKQHGHMEAIGYDLYCKMLNEAVLECKGELVEKAYETTVDVNIDAFIPATYIKSEFQKLEMYKKIADIEKEEEWMDMQEELVDRFGELPKSVENLLGIVLIKALAHNIYITQIKQKQTNYLEFTMYEKANVRVEGITELLSKYNGKLKFIPQHPPIFQFQWRTVKGNVKGTQKIDSYEMIESARSLLKDMNELLSQKEK